VQRLLLFVTVGSLYCAPVIHYWLEFLDWLIKRPQVASRCVDYAHAAAAAAAAGDGDGGGGVIGWYGCV
jgi:hypothetical protein